MNLYHELKCHETMEEFIISFELTQLGEFNFELIIELTYLLFNELKNLGIKDL